MNLSYAEFEYRIHGEYQGVIRVSLQEEMISAEVIAQMIAKKIKVILPDDFHSLCNAKGFDALRWFVENYGLSLSNMDASCPVSDAEFGADRSNMAAARRRTASREAQ